MANIREHNAWITDWPITEKNVAALVASGRARWKIENEHNNTLKAVWSDLWVKSWATRASRHRPQSGAS